MNLLGWTLTPYVVFGDTKHGWLGCHMWHRVSAEQPFSLHMQS